jgi:hypothetical protein
MTDSPLIQEIVAEATKGIVAEARKADLIKFLQGRFGPIPADLSMLLQRIEDGQKLDLLVERAARCKDLNSFRQGLTPS